MYVRVPKYKGYIKKLAIFIILILSIILFTFTNKINASNYVYLGGDNIFIDINTKVTVVKVNDNIKKKYNIKENDVISKVDDISINTIKDFENIVSPLDEYKLELIRNNKKIVIKVRNNEDLGFYLKDSYSVVGSLSFIKDDVFASLAHKAIDNNINGYFGKSYIGICNGYTKSNRSNVGEKYCFNSNELIGYNYINSNYGVYGKISDEMRSNITNRYKINVGKAKIGEAFIYTSLSKNTIKTYSISINDIIYGDIKQIKFEITDSFLLDKTNGIICGMSGSPIVQDGLIVGCVSHVNVNNPKLGYALDINKMIDEASKVSSISKIKNVGLPTFFLHLYH